MHAAPSVNYPVGRSRFAGALLAGAWLLGALALLAWTLQAQAPGWRQLAASLLLAACGAAALAAWWQSPAGFLAWDGAGWRWTAAGQPDEAGQPELTLDLQSHLLLRWTPAAAGRRRWLWAMRDAAPSHWNALRRAIYSRSNTAAAQGPEPPVAER
ncbi:hypothetical protein HHL11_24370 [Ramlibacter sp. G-1-2-2]|uniref:Toxin CptA n=1 Tax=Ramlibacter agri TaxID=2728837 RepID=A0A848HEE0_9BURK|nr:hypothetical protein [Ramlibacter agri]NML46903.1 hypothetical protein [Ramlibacter agri]